MSESGGRRPYLLTLLLLAVGGALGLAAASRPWGEARTPSALSVASSTTVSGADLLPFAPAVALVALAAVVVVPAVRRIGRRIVGAVLVALGAALAITAELTVLDLEARIEEWVTASPDGGRVEQVTTVPGWGLAVAAAGVMVLVAGLLVAVRGPSWPAMGRKYERSARPAGRAAAQAEAANARQAWDALDRGDDPT